MKNTIIIFLFIFSIAASAQVRNYKKPAANAPQAKSQPQKKTTTYNSSNASTEPKLGIVAHYQFANVISNNSNSEFTPGICAGISIQKELSSGFSFNIDCLYSEMGAKSGIYSNDLVNKLTYTQFPITLKAKVFDLLYFQLGPQFGYLMSVTSDGEDIDDFKEFYKTIDYGAYFGSGIEIPGTNFGIGGKIYYGLNGLFKGDFGDSKPTNLSYSFGAHYYF